MRVTMRIIGVSICSAVAPCTRGRDSASATRRCRPSPAVAIEPGDALALARAYLDQLGITELYVADLDAITAAVLAAGHARRRRWRHSARRSGWTPASVLSRSRAPCARPRRVASSSSGSRRCRRTTRSQRSAPRSAATRVAFSLDLRDGEPIVAPSALVVGAAFRRAGRHVIAARAADAGVGALIVIDLARVGTGAGLDLRVDRARARRRAGR